MAGVERHRETEMTLNYSSIKLAATTRRLNAYRQQKIEEQKKIEASRPQQWEEIAVVIHDLYPATELVIIQNYIKQFNLTWDDHRIEVLCNLLDPKTPSSERLKLLSAMNSFKSHTSQGEVVGEIRWPFR
jgi:hypothetical protein